MTTNDSKYDLFKAELSIAQGQMDKYDQLSSSMKTWAITLWAAAIGWSIQTHIPTVVLIGTASTILFWFMDAYIMTFRLNYKDRRNAAAEALRAYADMQEFPSGAPVLEFPTHENGGLMRTLSILHISLPYLALLVFSVAAFFLIVR